MTDVQTAEQRNYTIDEIIESVKARQELCESAEVYGWAADRLVEEIERLRGLLHGIHSCAQFEACQMCRDLLDDFCETTPDTRSAPNNTGE